MIARTDLSNAIANRQWSVATMIAKKFPEQARKKSKRDGLFDGETVSKLYPLHEALVENAPLECVSVHHLSGPTIRNARIPTWS